MTARSLDRYPAVVLRHRWPVLALSTLLMLVIAAGAGLVGVTNDYRAVFDEDNPHLAALDSFENTYGATNPALIAIAPREGSVFSRKTLGAIEELTETAWHAPHSTRVDSLTNYSHSRANGDELIVEPLVEDATSLKDSDLARVEKVALGAPEIAGRLVSRDGSVAGLAIGFALPEDRDAAVIEITDWLDDMLRKARVSHPDIAYYLTGDLALNRAFVAATQNDFESLAPIAFLIITAVAAVLLRSIFGTVAIVAVLIFVVSTAVGLAGWLGTVFNPTNSSVPIIVMTVALAYSVHIVETTLAGLSRGLDRRAAAAESIRVNAWPVFLASLTTIIGFLSLNASDSPPFRVLGNLVAFGVLCSFVYSLTLLPCLLSVLPLRACAVRSGQSDFFDRVGAFVVARRSVLLWSTAVLAIALVTGLPRLELTDNWTKYFSESYQFRQDTDFIVENLTGTETLEYSLDSGREGGITEPAYLSRVDALAEWFRKQPEVFHVQAFSDIMKRLNRNMHGDDPVHYRLPDDPELSAQYLLLYELSVPFGRDLNNRMDIAKSATRMTVVLRSLTSQQQRELDVRALAWMKANTPGLSSGASGVSIVFAHLTQRNIDSMLTGTIVAMGLISLILIFVFRSLLIGLISLVPNFIPAAMSLGLWGHLVGHVGLAGSVTAAIAFGIVVDDTVHFLTRYRSARRDGLAAPEAVRSAFRTVGHALWTTTAVLALGFLVFALSGFEVTWTLGLLVASTVGFALLTDFLLLPPLLIVLDRRRPQTMNSALPLPPGPRGLPVLGSLPALRGTLHVSLDRLVRSYGDICLIRLGSVPVAIISHPKLLEQTFGKTELTNRWMTDAAFALTEGRTPATASYGELWRRFDRFIRHEMFGADNLTMLRRNHIEPEVDELMERIGRMAGAGEPVHPNDMLSDSACRMALRTYFLVDGEDKDWAAELERVAVLLREHFEAVNTLTATPEPGDVFPWARFLPNKAVRKARRLNDARQEILGPLLDRVRSRSGFDPSSPVCLAEVVTAWEKSGSLSRRTMCGMLADTMQPHFDGVASTVKWFLLTVANRPQVQAKIHEELDRVVGRDALPAVDDRGRLPYTFAAIAECMRFHTASPLGIPHEASQDTEVGGYRIEAGTKVFGNLYGIHHDPRFWESPHEFIPERFLPKADGSPSSALTGGAFIPFGAGLRRCTGERPAEIEVWLYIARLMHRFRFERPTVDLLSEFEVHGLTITPRPYALKATRR